MIQLKSQVIFLEKKLSDSMSKGIPEEELDEIQNLRDQLEKSKKETLEAKEMMKQMEFDIKSKESEIENQKALSEQKHEFLE